MLLSSIEADLARKEYSGRSGSQVVNITCSSFISRGDSRVEPSAVTWYGAE